VPAFASNLDKSCAWVVDQMGTYQDAWSFHSFKFVSLVRDPVGGQHTLHSFPTMLYASFWASHWDESAFAVRMLHAYPYFTSVIYLVALPATLLMVAGVLRWFGRFLLSLRSPVQLRETLGQGETVAVLVFFAGLSLLYVATRVYDVCSIQQARLLFPSIFAGLILFGRELDEWRARRGIMATCCRVYIPVLLALLLTYSLVNFAGAAWELRSGTSTVFAPG
jgi:hypothetical protein